MYKALDSRGASHRFTSTNDAVSPCKRVSHLVGLEQQNVGVGTRNGGQKLDFKGQRSERASPVISVESKLTTLALRLLGRSKKVDIPSSIVLYAHDITRSILTIPPLMPQVTAKSAQVHAG